MYLVVIGDLVEGAKQTSIFRDRMGALPTTSYMVSELTYVEDD